jgi:hypothetical protein
MTNGHRVQQVPVRQNGTAHGEWHLHGRVWAQNVNITLALLTDYQGGLVDRRPGVPPLVNKTASAVYIEYVNHATFRNVSIVWTTPVRPEWEANIDGDPHTVHTLLMERCGCVARCASALAC